MSETKRFPLVGGCGPLYSKLYELLTSTTADALTDEQISQEVGVRCDPKAKGTGYSTLTRVAKAVEKTGRTWKRERGAGVIRRLAEPEKIGHATTLTSRASRIVKRGAVVVGTIDSSKLTPEERVKANALSAQLGAIALMSTSSTTKKLEARQGETVADAATVLSLISGKTAQLKLAQ